MWVMENAIGVSRIISVIVGVQYPQISTIDHHANHCGGTTLDQKMAVVDRDISAIEVKRFSSGDVPDIDHDILQTSIIDCDISENAMALAVIIGFTAESRLWKFVKIKQLRSRRSAFEANRPLNHGLAGGPFLIR